ncbi:MULTISPECIES: hypothetical protein [unclassified Epibacterium]|uniref:hypothetical protein n=1 Tax=unclassified Epibacterium TaxID=2639179 RepID=UPI001EF6D3F7|nr:MULTISPECIES: hypothetical protein [unclassified Epibacterium]MCG7623366.1 hypothetical protein [Epibacterium sp. Ofav1-8]MCG7626313.1 hypothetical protein [Epibacterium sp. MM17-32]
MRITIGALLVGTLVLSSCGGWRDSRINPGNWFGQSRDSRVEATADENLNPLIPQEEDRVNLIGSRKDAEQVDNSLPIARIKDMRIERTSVGAILTVEGEAARNGAYKAELVPSEIQEAGRLEYTFRVTYPKSATYRGTEATRTIRAAVSLSNQDLAGVRTIRVVGKENARESRR